MGTLGSCLGHNEHRGFNVNLCMLCTACFFLALNTDFVGNTNTNNLILSTIYIVISVSGSAGRAPVHCFAQRSIMLLRQP